MIPGAGFWPALGAGAVAGYGIAIPVGAVGAYLVALSARRGLAVGAAAALGVASADGIYATLAVLGGAWISRVVGTLAPAFSVAAGLVLLLLASWTAVVAVTEYRSSRTARFRGSPAGPSPARAYAVLLGATLLNPTTVVYFAALVLGAEGSVFEAPSERAGFVLGALLASASWQLLLATGGSLLGRLLTGRRGRLISTLVSAAVIALLAAWTLAG